MWPSEPTKAHILQGSLLYLNQLSGRLPEARVNHLPVNCKGSEIFSTTAQFIKEIDAVGEKLKKIAFAIIHAAKVQQGCATTQHMR